VSLGLTQGQPRQQGSGCARALWIGLEIRTALASLSWFNLCMTLHIARLAKTTSREGYGSVAFMAASRVTPNSSRISGLPAVAASSCQGHTP